MTILLVIKLSTYILNYEIIQVIIEFIFLYQLFLYRLGQYYYYYFLSLLFKILKSKKIYLFYITIGK